MKNIDFTKARCRFQAMDSFPGEDARAAGKKSKRRTRNVYPKYMNRSNPMGVFLYGMISETRAREEKLVSIIKALIVHNQSLEQNRGELEKTCEKFREQAVRDPLTGLFNRRYMEATLIREACRIKRRGSSMGIIMMDVDNFKWVNDNCGHHAGDVVLKSLGAWLQNNIRVEDIACRYGGEEFLLILPDIGVEDLRSRAEGMRKEIMKQNFVHYQNRLHPLTVSMGAAIYPDRGEVETVLKMADDALYMAKKNGKNQVVMAPFQQASLITTYR